MIDPPTIQYELAERTQAIAAGGLGVVQQLVRQLFHQRFIDLTLLFT